ncbi:MAG: hypothetical protein AAGH88_03700 [Planctomycetota bacterium]
MPFTSGRVSFCRFLVTGDAPTSVDETFLDILQEHRFRETEIGAPDETEAGFVTVEHLFDTQFTYEKVGYGPHAVFALRIDTHKVPGEVKRAYQKMNEQAAAAASPTGFASKAEKRDAKDLAGRQASEDLAAGKFRRSRSVQITWDLANGRLYCSNSATSVVEQLVKLMRQAFSVELQPITAGTLAGHLLSQTGRSRDYEDLHPSAFTKPPADTGPGDDEAAPRDRHTPICPWVTRSIDLKDFLGNEMLTWLWWQCESEEGTIQTGKAGDVFFAVTRTLDMDCAWEVGGKQTLRCDKPTSLAEANDALKTGKWPRKMGLIVSDGEYTWDLTLQGDTLNVASTLLPDTSDAQTPREIIEQRLQLIGTLAFALDSVYETFIKQRTASGWGAKREAMSRWIRERGRADRDIRRAIEKSEAARV